MDYSVKVTEHADYVRVVLSGLPSIDQFQAIFGVLGVESGDWAHEVMLLDMREVESKFSLEDEYRIGSDFVANLGHLRKVASVVPTERMTGTCERAARRRRAELRVFDSEHQALDWLRAP